MNRQSAFADWRFDEFRRLSASAACWLRIDDFGHFENRQEHTNDHAADDDAKEDNQNWFDQRRETGKSRFDFFVEEVRDTLQHTVKFAGLLSGGNHADDHVRENRMLAQRDGNALAALNVDGGHFDGFFHDDIADGLRNDLQHFQNGHATANE